MCSATTRHSAGARPFAHLRGSSAAGGLLSRSDLAARTATRRAGVWCITVPRPWQIGEPLLGRPRRQIVLRLNQRLLDTCIGKITPHPVRTALIERYMTAPLLGLADVGVYVLCLAGQRMATEPLTRQGLVCDGQAQALPSDQQLLALASQRALETDEPTSLT